MYIKGVLRKKPVVMEFEQATTVKEILRALSDKHGTPRGVLVEEQFGRNFRLQGEMREKSLLPIFLLCQNLDFVLGT